MFRGQAVDGAYAVGTGVGSQRGRMTEDFRRRVEISPAQVIVNLAAAGRDPARQPRPEALDSTRPNSTTLPVHHT